MLGAIIPSCGTTVAHLPRSQFDSSFLHDIRIYKPVIIKPISSMNDWSLPKYFIFFDFSISTVNSNLKLNKSPLVTSLSTVPQPLSLWALFGMKMSRYNFNCRNQCLLHKKDRTTTATTMKSLDCKHNKATRVINYPDCEFFKKRQRKQVALFSGPVSIIFIPILIIHFGSTIRWTFLEYFKAR